MLHFSGIRASRIRFKLANQVGPKKGCYTNSSRTCLSSSISITTKYIGKMNFLTLISTSSRMPSSWAKVMSAIYRVMAVGVSSPKLSILTIDKGIKLMLAPKSHSVFHISEFPILQGVVKLPGSCIFSGKDFWITALQVAVRLTTPSSTILLVMLNISFMNFA